MVVVDGLAASGGYIAAMSADHIVAQETSLVGSIGVLFQYPNVSELLKTVGVKIEEVEVLAAQGGAERLRADQSGGARRHRGAGEGLLCLVPRHGAASAARWTTRRSRPSPTGACSPAGRRSRSSSSTSSATRRPRSPGSTTEKGLKADTPVRDWQLKPRFSDLSMLHLATAVALDAVGLRSLAQRIEGSVQAVERLNLDGLLALWHPPVTN